MKIGIWAGALVLLFGTACTEGTEGQTGRPTTVTQATAALGCPLGIEGALASSVRVERGVFLTLLTTPEKLDDLRLRARHAGSVHGPDARVGLGHDGKHGEGGGHGLQAFQLPPFDATVFDIESGVVIALMPVDAADGPVLVERVANGVHRMNATPCK